MVFKWPKSSGINAEKAISTERKKPATHKRKGFSLLSRIFQKEKILSFRRRPVCFAGFSIWTWSSFAVLLCRPVLLLLLVESGSTVLYRRPVSTLLLVEFSVSWWHVRLYRVSFGAVFMFLLLIITVILESISFLGFPSHLPFLSFSWILLYIKANLCFNFSLYFLGFNQLIEFVQPKSLFSILWFGISVRLISREFNINRNHDFSISKIVAVFEDFRLNYKLWKL